MPTQNDQVVLAVAIHVAGRHVPLHGSHVGHAHRSVFMPFALGRLIQNEQMIGQTEAGEVRAAVAVEVPHGHRGQLFVERDFLVLEPPVAGNLVDVQGRRVGRRFGGPPPLQQKVDPRMPVVEERQVAQAVAVKVARQQVADPRLELDDFDRLEAVVLAEIAFVGRFRANSFDRLLAGFVGRPCVTPKSEQRQKRNREPRARVETRWQSIPAFRRSWVKADTSEKVAQTPQSITPRGQRYRMPAANRLRPETQVHSAATPLIVLAKRASFGSLF